jgi:15-cis-phytoene desaturase
MRMVPGLLPMLLEGQSFIDKQDELSVLEFMDKYGMPTRINEEIFIAMGKASPLRHTPALPAHSARCRRSPEQPSAA